eukprot:GHVU01008132.1.p1 GENE.GHVU01008132.1~~GHVU01008132.1.p1  ORF type:complete len:475 (+),score=69.93 GHVU01008132.1:268-1692(+)
MEAAVADIGTEGAGMQQPTSSSGEKVGYRGKKRPRELDWSQWGYHKFLLTVSYVGTGYSGMAYQVDESAFPTIESELFKALILTRLIRDRNSCEFTRCGRTDAGVHAKGNCVALTLRLLQRQSSSSSSSSPSSSGQGYVEEGRRDEETNGSRKKGEGWRSTPAVHDTAFPGAAITESARKYPTMLNGVLPSAIRVRLALPVNPDFHARFDCSFRTYKYFLVATGLDAELMSRAAQKFVGTHDFRNFCKMDAKNVRSFRRRVLSIEVRSDVDEMGGRISPSAAATATVGGEEDTPPPPPPSRLPRGRNCITEITIKGYAFLWQQVRCMVGVLALIGAGHDCAETIDRLLDIEAYPRKPVDSLRKACEPEQNPLKAMQSRYAEALQQCAVIADLADHSPLPYRDKSKVPLVERPTGLSLEERKGGLEIGTTAATTKATMEAMPAAVKTRGIPATVATAHGAADDASMLADVDEGEE